MAQLGAIAMWRSYKCTEKKRWIITWMLYDWVTPNQLEIALKLLAEFNFSQEYVKELADF